MSKLGDRIFDWAESFFPVNVAILVVEDIPYGNEYEVCTTHFNRAAWDLWRIAEDHPGEKREIVEKRILNKPVDVLMTNAAPNGHSNLIRRQQHDAIKVGEQLAEKYEFNRMGAGRPIEIDAFDGSNPKIELKFCSFRDETHVVSLAIAQSSEQAEGLLANQLVNFVVDVTDPDKVDAVNEGLQKRKAALTRLAVTISSIGLLVAGFWKGPDVVNNIQQSAPLSPPAQPVEQPQEENPCKIVDGDRVCIFQ